MKKLCYDDHECISCHNITKCGTYTWACPWRNDDEDQMCGRCMEEWKRELEESMAAEERLI